jgi:hypothetical protein
MKEDVKELNRKRIGYAILFFFAVLYCILLILPSTYFDEGSASCLSVVLFNQRCYGCGMTRAIQHLIHFEVNKAIEFNALSLLVLPLSIYMIIWEIRKRFFKR